MPGISGNLGRGKVVKISEMNDSLLVASRVPQRNTSDAGPSATFVKMVFGPSTPLLPGRRAKVAAKVHVAAQTKA